VGRAPYPNSQGSTDMQVFNIRARLRTGITVSRPIHLDGLLLAAREQRENHLDMERPLDCITMDRGVYRASAAFMVAPGLQGAAIQPMYRTWRFRIEDTQVLSSFRATAASPRSERVLPTSNSKYRNGYRRQDVMTGIESLVWQCVGDPEAVLSLAREIHCIGAASNTGFGRVREWGIEPCEATEAEAGWFAGNRVLRSLPESHVPAGISIDRAHAVLDTQRAVPPYWDTSGRVRCWAPTLDSLIVDGDGADDILKAA
jgi:CRISPR type IV-associated protein Csf3